MQIAFGTVSQAGAASGAQTTAATMSFTQSPMESWTTQRLDSPTGQRFLQAISQVTGLSQSDVTSQLQGGATLQSILNSNGATFADVRQAVRSQGGQVQFGGHHHHGGRAADAAAASATLGAVADTLGMSQSDLEQQLSSGVSLSSLASAQGVSQDALLGSIQDALQSFLGYSPTGGQAGVTPASGLQVDTTA